MKRRPWNSVLWLVVPRLLSGCGRLDSIPYEPRQTPEMWLAGQPFVEIGHGPQRLVLVQPSSTVVVYLLGMVAIGSGLYIWRIRSGHRSRTWWASALALWGLGALFAGTSYQAFSYEIKCAGHEVSTWTSFGLILWMIYIGLFVSKRVVDVADSASGRELAWSK